MCLVFNHATATLHLALPKRVMIYLTWSAPSLWHGLRAYAREAGWLLAAPPTLLAGPPKAPRVFDGLIILPTEYTAFDARKFFPGAKIVDILGAKD